MTRAGLWGAALAGTLLVGCAGTGAPEKAREAAAEKDAAALETLRPGLRTAEDSLILDLLIGYRVLADRAGTPSDAPNARGAERAQARLQPMLAHGGIKDRDRVYALPGGEKATLEEFVNQMSRALLRAPAGTAWRPDSDRAREIQRHRPELSSLAEDADWILSLSAALEGPLPEDVKKRLRRLEESYAAKAPHAEIASQVNSLLKDIDDEPLRLALKKLANRSWERERQAGKNVPATPPTANPSAAAPTPPATAPSAPAVQADSSLDSTESPERYCSERRAAAARYFAGARAAKQPAARTQLLRQSLGALDDCLGRFPGSPEAEKARHNRETVEKELKP